MADSASRTGRGSATVTMLASAAFARAVTSLTSIRPRAEIIVEELAPPRRLAPYAHALSASVTAGGVEVAHGRLVLLFDPAGQESWEGTTRLVSFVSAEMDAPLMDEPGFDAICWSWLTDALAAHSANHIALAGTVTRIRSTVFTGASSDSTVDIRPFALVPDQPHAPVVDLHTASAQQDSDLEMRASWTAQSDDLGPHAYAWYDFLAELGGLPPSGVTALRPRTS